MDEAGGGEAAASSAFCTDRRLKAHLGLKMTNVVVKKAAAIGPGATLEERTEKEPRQCAKRGSSSRGGKLNHPHEGIQGWAGFVVTAM